MFVQINWGNTGGFYYIPLEIQRSLFYKLGREKYIQLPKPGTNPRGVEISKEALSILLQAKGTKVIDITWNRSAIDYDPYKRWVDYWKEE